MGIQPDVWGPSAWRLIHLVCHHAPELMDEPIGNLFRRWLHGFGDVIPCKTCRDHFKETLKSVPITDRVVSGREALFAWSVEAHNHVNATLGKGTWTVPEARAHWDAVAAGKAPQSAQKESWAVGWALAWALGALIGATVTQALNTFNRPRRT